MKYIDVFYQVYRINYRTKHRDAFYANLQGQVLVWSANHEHAVFDLWDNVHPASTCVWFQYRRGQEDTIHKIQRKCGKWRKAEVSVGKIPFVSHNPFDPRKQNAASNTAPSVFPQNKGNQLC